MSPLQLKPVCSMNHDDAIFMYHMHVCSSLGLAWGRLVIQTRGADRRLSWTFGNYHVVPRQTLIHSAA